MAVVDPSIFCVWPAVGVCTERPGGLAGEWFMAPSFASLITDSRRR